MNNQPLYRIFFELSGQPIAILSRESFKFLDATPQFCQMIGYSLIELISLEFQELFSEVEQLKNKLFNNKDPQVLSVLLKHKNQQELDLKVSCKPVELNDSFFYFMTFNHQITQNELELKQQNLELQQLNQLKNEFVANISHELRTPLTTILGWPEIIIDMDGEPQIAIQAAKAIQKDGQVLLKLLEDVIDLSKIEAGQLELDLRPEPIEDILLQAINMVKNATNNKHIRLESYFEEIPPVKIDPIRILQVILNFLSNAIKFTPEKGNINVKAYIENERVVVCVEDNGIGIKPEDQALIFQHFKQVKEQKKNSQDGSGIGLSLAKSFVELHQGNIWVKSTYNKGSSFYFDLPLELEPTPQNSGNTDEDISALNGWPQNPIQILLIDDRDDIRAVLKAMLVNDLIKVYTSNDFSQATSLAKEFTPDCILLDVSRPDLSLSGVFHELKNGALTSNIPIIALTAFAMKGDKERVLRFGYDGYIAKPCTKADLLKCIKQVITKIR